MEHHLPRWFQLIKYSVYALLALNVWLFLQEELTTTAHLFEEGISGELLIQAFSATIDTLAWVILLLMFELETYQLPDEVIKGKVKWSLHGLRVVCYLFIGYACYGYVVEMLYYYEVSALAVANPCSLVGQDYSIMVKLDEFIELSAESCGMLEGELWQLGAAPVVVDADQLQVTRWLAWTDVINSATWILVVLLLEFDVQMQLRGSYTGRVLLVSKLFKVALYGLSLIHISEPTRPTT